VINHDFSSPVLLSHITPGHPAWNYRVGRLAHGGWHAYHGAGGLNAIQFAIEALPKTIGSVTFTLPPSGDAHAMAVTMAANGFEDPIQYCPGECAFVQMMTGDQLRAGDGVLSLYWSSFRGWDWEPAGMWAFVRIAAFDAGGVLISLFADTPPGDAPTGSGKTYIWGGALWPFPPAGTWTHFSYNLRDNLQSILLPGKTLDDVAEVTVEIATGNESTDFGNAWFFADVRYGLVVPGPLPDLTVPVGGSASWEVSATGGAMRLKGNAAATESGSARVLVDGVEVGTFPFAGDGVYGMTIPQTHPRLYLDASRLATARTWFAANPFAPDGSPGTAFDYIHNLTHGLLSQNDAERRVVLDWAIAHTATIGTTGLDHDRTRWEGEAIILAYDWAHDLLTPAEKAAFIAETNEWITYWRTQTGWGTPNMVDNNYNWGHIRNQLLWGIASYHDNPSAESFLQNALEVRLEQNFYDRVTHPGLIGGVGREGTQYGYYSHSYAALAFEAATLLGRDLWAETPFWKESIYWFVYCTTPQFSTWQTSATRTGYTLFPFSEDETWRNGSVIDYQITDFMAAIALRYAAVPAGQHARQWLNMVVNTDYDHRSRWSRSVDPGSPALAFAALPLDWYGPGVGHLVVRDAWTGAPTVVHLDLKDGPGNGHENADWGSWQIWRAGRFVSRESPSYGDMIAGWHGVGTVSGDHAFAHNSLLVNGLSAHNDEFSEGAAVVSRLQSAPGFAFAATDLSALCNMTGWVRWARDFVWVRGLTTLVVLDRVQSSAADAVKSQLVHSETSPVINGVVATLTNGTQQLVVTPLVPANPTVGVINEGGVGQYRIEIDTSPGTAQSYILTVHQAKAAADAALAPSVVDNGTHWTVTLNASVSIRLDKGMTSAGGSITIDGVTTSFRSDVQAISVTDAGPVWGA
jgi:hypothetical protein